MDLKEYVTIVPDYPKEGISFKDISTIMDNGKPINMRQMKLSSLRKKLERILSLALKHVDSSSDVQLLMRLKWVLLRFVNLANCHGKRLRSNMILNMEKIH